MKTFIGTIFLGLFIAVNFVYRMDPGYRWRDAPTPFSRNLAPDEVRIFPTNFDERTVKASHLKFIDKPQVLLLGSSRVAQVSSSAFNPSAKIFNGGVSSATFEDYIAMWEILKEEKKIPQKVIIFVDPWQFSHASNEKLTGWHNFEAPINSFLIRKGILMAPVEDPRPQMKKRRTLQERIERSRNQIEHNLSEAAQFFSWPMVKASVLLFYKDGIFNDRISKRIVKLKDFTDDDRGVLYDGATIYPIVESSEKKIEDIQRLAQEWVSKPNYFDGWTLDPQAQRRFRALLEDMVNEGSDILLLFPPLHPLIPKLIEEKKESAHAFSEAQEMFKSSLPATNKITLCNAQDMATIGCSETEMMDGVHMRTPCINKVMRFCLKGKVWGPLSPQDGFL